MRLIISNPSSDDCVYGTVTVPAESSLETNSSDWFGIFSDSNFWKDLQQNNVILNDGVKNYSFEEAINYMTFLTSVFNYNNKDIDGALITRAKAAKKGWSFWALPPEITTSTLGGTLYCKDSAGVDIPGVSCKIYDANNTEITIAGLLNANLATCVKTVLDIEVPFDTELIGGALRIHSNPAQDIRLWIVGAPDIPAQYGGSKEFASGVNLKFLAPDSSFDIDGRVTKYITYNGTTHTGKIRLIFKHPAGLQVNMQVVIQLYRL